MTNRFDHRFHWIMALEDEPARHEGLTQLLTSSGFAYGARSATNLLLLEGFSIARLLKITLAALHAPSPDMALNGFERLAGVLDKSLLENLVNDRRNLVRFMNICGASPFLTNLIYREPCFFQRLFEQKQLEQPASHRDLLNRFRQAVPDDADLATLFKALRCCKRFEILRIAARDLCGFAPLTEVMEELSHLAAVSLQIALENCQQLLELEHGTPLTMEGRPAAMTIIGMGKLGGRELNFSSDIDIIYFYETDQGETSGIDDDKGGRKGVLPLHTFFCKLAEMISKALNQVTEDGFVFRVDLGLRPEGMSGEMAVSLQFAESYYESWGQSWERAALLKARPVAGSLKLGEQLLASLTPFVYRKYLDYTLIEDMKLMKQKIDSSLARKREGEQNLKLGRGGIREIEFFIQALQLVYAGKNPGLRERNSLKALNLLANAGLITEKDRQQLADAYCFLRTVEHRIQVVQERQTHSLPIKAEELAALARRCGFLREQGTDRFMELLEKHRQQVSAIYAGIFYEQEQADSSQISPEIFYLLDPKAEPDLAKDMLAERGIEDVDAGFDNLTMLRGGALKRKTSSRVRRIITRISPFMLESLLESPDPDMALASSERFFAAVLGRVATFALLAENPEPLKLLATLFGTSQFLSKILISHPELLEAMVARSYLSTVKQKKIMQAELGALLTQAEDFESRLDVLRRYRNEEFLRIGMNDIHGQLKQGSIAQQLTSLAETSLAAAYEIAKDELARFGSPCYQEDGENRAAGMAIIAMGKLGGRELNYHSDLDIIFVYDKQGLTSGNKQITNHEYFAKLAQKLILVLSTLTREGYAYKLDTRLRPSGNAGPLVTSLESFAAYHQNDAQIWERQALSKARVVLGSRELVRQVEDVITLTVYGAGLDHGGRQEIHRLRMRMEHEIAHERAGTFNIKTGRGGMVDVEFIAQYLQLSHGYQHKTLRLTRTVDLIAEAARLGLLAKADAEQLVNGYKFLRKLENRLRLIHDHSINDLADDQRYLDKLARRLGYNPKLRHPGKELMDDYIKTTDAIRHIYSEIFEDNG